MDDFLCFKYKENLQLWGVSIQNSNIDTDPLIAVSTLPVEGNELGALLILEIDDNNTNCQLKLKTKLDQLSFPLSKVMFSNSTPSLLAYTDVDITLCKIEANSNSIVKISTNQDENNQEKAPLTSFDWRENRIVTSSYDTTCTVWEIKDSSLVKSEQYIAHEKEVNDVKCLNDDTILSCGGDASVRLMDLRDMDSLNILFESSECKSLNRLSINPFEKNYFIVSALDKSLFYLVDLRDTSTAVEKFFVHTDIINCLSFTDSHGYFYSGSDDKYLNIWSIKDFSTDFFDSKQPSYSYTDNINPINNCDWKDGLLAINCFDTLKLMKI